MASSVPKEARGAEHPGDPGEDARPDTYPPIARGSDDDDDGELGDESDLDSSDEEALSWAHREAIRVANLGESSSNMAPGVEEQQDAALQQMQQMLAMMTMQQQQLAVDGQLPNMAGMFGVMPGAGGPQVPTGFTMPQQGSNGSSAPDGPTGRPNGSNNGGNNGSGNGGNNGSDGSNATAGGNGNTTGNSSGGREPGEAPKVAPDDAPFAPAAAPFPTPADAEPPAGSGFSAPVFAQAPTYHSQDPPFVEPMPAGGDVPGDGDLGASREDHEMMENCATLPMRQSAEAFIDAVRAHRVTIVLGATGSGKSTQVPTLLDEAGLAGPGRLIAMTQPRRAAAKCLALRVEEEVQAAARCGMYLSDERGPPAVGCWTRFDRCDPANVNIMYMTEGVLVGKLISERRSAVDLAQRVAMHREKQRKKKGGGGGGGGGDDDQDPATSSSTPLQPKADAMCAVCGIAAKLMCSACKTTPYCTVECQRRGWKKLGHKADCPQINAARLAAERAEEQARAAAEEAEAKRAAEDLADDLVAEWIEQGLARTEERVADTSFASSGGTGWLRRCGVLVIDEAHERSLDTDVILGWIKAVERFRPDLKVVISSATLQSSDFADFFGCTDAAIVSVKGRQYPVAKRFIEPAALGLSPARAEEPLSAFPLDRDTGRRMLPEDDLGPDVVARVVARAVAEVVTSPSCDEEAAGNIVAFLPGADECEDTLSFVRTILEAAGDAVRIADAVDETLEYDFEDEYALLPLYGSLPLDQQLEATTRKDSRGRRKIIFATNVAETSLTIEGVTVIVDSGLEKVMRYDADAGVERLEVVAASQSSLEQRAGRAGRERPGACIRCITPRSFENRPEHRAAAIQSSSLSTVLLKLFAMGVEDPVRFPYITAPKKDAVKAAVATLEELGAISRVFRDESVIELALQRNSDEIPRAAIERFRRVFRSLATITELGRKIAKLAVEPHHGRLLVLSLERGCTADALDLAAISAVRSPFYFRKDIAAKCQRNKQAFAVHNAGDHALLINVFRKFHENVVVGQNRTWCFDNGLVGKSLWAAKTLRSELWGRVVSLCAGDRSLADQSFGPIEDAWGKLAAVLLDAKAVRIAGFLSQTGRNPRSHYVTVSPATQKRIDAMVHPSSVTPSDTRARALMFNKVLVTSASYMLEVSPVPVALLSKVGAIAHTQRRVYHVPRSFFSDHFSGYGDYDEFESDEDCDDDEDEFWEHSSDDEDPEYERYAGSLPRDVYRRLMKFYANDDFVVEHDY